MKKKGFTLIELLAVIVVLAIIALIATPIVMNVIKDSKKGATERSAERYLDAVETAIATDRLQNALVADGIYDVIEDGNLVLGEKKLPVEVNGDVPKAGSKVAIQNGQVVKDGTNLNYGDYTVTIDDKGSAKATEKGNEIASVVCNAIAPTEQPISNSIGFEEWAMTTATAGVQATEASPFSAGATYSCDLGDGERIFYVLKEDGSNVKLILNENLYDEYYGYQVAWIEELDYKAAGGKAWFEFEDTNTFGPITANKALADRTIKWTKLKEVGGKVELPTHDEISSVQGQIWLRTNLDGYNVKYAAGYWTSSPSDAPDGAWFVGYDGILNASHIASFTHIGVRPVITIPKANLSL